MRPYGFQVAELCKRARAVRLSVVTNSPGDGRRRYQFITPGTGNYVSPTLISYREADIWLRGYEKGVQ